jgi:hypothetical protein
MNSDNKFSNFFYKINFLFVLFFNKNFNLINSPLQYINFIEYIKKNKILGKNITIVGYTNSNSIKQIKFLNFNFLKNEKIFFLTEIINVKYFHLILYLKKFFTGFDQCVIGDFNYYLFKEFYKYSKKNIILDDGTSTLEIPENKLKKNTILFTIFKNLKNIYSENLVENNYDFLKSKIQGLNIDQKKIYIIGSASVERKVITRRKYNKLINLILSKNENRIVHYIPHRLEIDLKDIKSFRGIIIKKINMPIEIFLLKENYLPKKIFSFFSTSLFTIKKIYGLRIECYNLNYNIKNISCKKIRLRHLKISKEFIKYGIKKFI